MAGDPAGWIGRGRDRSHWLSDFDSTKELCRIACRFVVDLVNPGGHARQINVMDRSRIASFFGDLRDNANNDLRASIFQVYLPDCQSGIESWLIVDGENFLAVLFNGALM